MKKQEKSIATKIFVITLCVLLSVYALSIIFTLVWGFLSSFKNPYEFMFNKNWLGFPTLDKSNLANSREHFFGLWQVASSQS